MENGGNMFVSIQSRHNRGQTNNSTTNNIPGWDNNHNNNMWPSRIDWGGSGNSSSGFYTTSTTTPTVTDANPVHALMYPHSFHDHHQSLYNGDGSQLHPDPHLMCLKLGKRHYFEDTSTTPSLGDRHLGGFGEIKRGKPYYTDGVGVGPAIVVGSTTTSTLVPRCQVEGCHVTLINAKDYHRRHKVCEMHSKAPKVVVLGLEQRFCQQCSRFHAVSEFDDSKRSCRRRLAGHNERRRKSSHDSVSRNSSQVNKLMAGRFPYLSSPTGRALSLLSSKTDSWVSSSDLSSRCSAALDELIAENRATILARHLHHAMEDLGESQNGSNNSLIHHHQMSTEPHGWGSTNRYQETNNTHVTLDLMQVPSEQFRFLSVRGKTSKEEEEEECSQLWNSFEGAHVV